MFLKVVKGKKKKYLYLVEGYGKVKHRTICSLGALDNIAPNLLAVAEQLGLVDGKILLKPELAQIMQKVNWGAITIIEALWKQLGLDVLFEQLLRKRSIQFDLLASIKLILANRLLNPMSKLQLFHKQKEQESKNALELQHLYQKKNGYEYIVGSRIKNASKSIKEAILDESAYSQIQSDKEDSVKYLFLEYEKSDKKKEYQWPVKLLSTWSQKRARKDKKDREGMIDRAEGMIEKGGLKNARGARKYIEWEVRDIPRV